MLLASVPTTDAMIDDSNITDDVFETQLDWLQNSNYAEKDLVQK
jgi:hypothetical protein